MRRGRMACSSNMSKNCIVYTGLWLGCGRTNSTSVLQRRTLRYTLPPPDSPRMPSIIASQPMTRLSECDTRSDVKSSTLYIEFGKCWTGQDQSVVRTDPPAQWQSRQLLPWLPGPRAGRRHRLLLCAFLRRAHHAWFQLSVQRP
ncbi:hypothetical protein BDZ89DRAFT_338011 [Hymenopellis radicata]|nr:hypothetical protein BDZ89DRAFT_338011 [Hymenopellis radicata]